eukprot:scaffold211631_cov26-Tisochrysis_lutea.AAC.4
MARRPHRHSGSSAQEVGAPQFAQAQNGGNVCAVVRARARALPLHRARRPSPVRQSLARLGHRLASRCFRRCQRRPPRESHPQSDAPRRRSRGSRLRAHSRNQSRA